ncbi:MAG: hypothetical protein LBK60_08835 [Verrucomicrobiales bacterium]|jgi:hypothetical protein|nr:hypothetical protein [Verrucomicrobiales bacterium]
MADKICHAIFLKIYCYSDYNLLINKKNFMKKINKIIGLAFTALALTGITACNAATDGLAEAKAALGDATKITVTAPTKDNTWFAKHLGEAAKGKIVSFKVNPKADDEIIYVEKKDGAALVICPISDGQASVVTDKELVAQYKPKAAVQEAAPVAKASGNSSSGKSSWEVKGKTVTKGMTIAEVKKLLGEPAATEGNDILRYTNKNPFINVGTLKYWELKFNNSRLVDVQLDTSNIGFSL